MLRSKRINLIRTYVFEQGTVSMDDLVSEFNVSKNTIRRDIQLLVESGELKKVYGGVIANKADHNSKGIQFSQDTLENPLIAKSAAMFVEDGDIIYIDAENVTISMIEFLRQKKITVITNSLEFIQKSISYEHLNVISTGGLLDPKSQSFSAIRNEDLLDGYNITKAFLAPSGLSLDKGITHSSPSQSEFKKRIIDKSVEVYLLAEYFKFDKCALMTYSSLDRADYIITDINPEQKYVDFTRENNIHLVITSE